MKRLFTAVVLLLAACASQQQGSFVSDRISVVTRGSGPDVILIPGLASHRDVWSDAAETLDDRYRLHLVQVSGFAGAPAGANAQGPVMGPVADEIARYIAAAGLERPTVIGHSMGGSIGMLLAARHPNRVGRVMIVDMTPYVGAAFAGPSATPESVRAYADQLRTKILGEPIDSPSGTLQQMFATMTRSEAKGALLRQGVQQSDRQTVANAFHEVIVTDLRPELPRIIVPMTVLYVVPPNVPMAPAQFDAVMRSVYANAPLVKLIRIDESYHFIQFDQPSRFVAEVDAFMR